MSISSMFLELWQFLFYEGFTRNPEIGNTSVWVSPNIWRLASKEYQIDTKVSNKMLVNAAKYQGYSFYRIWVIKGKPSGLSILFLQKTYNQHNWETIFSKICQLPYNQYKFFPELLK